MKQQPFLHLSRNLLKDTKLISVRLKTSAFNPIYIEIQPWDTGKITECFMVSSVLEQQDLSGVGRHAIFS